MPFWVSACQWQEGGKRTAQTSCELRTPEPPQFGPQIYFQQQWKQGFRMTRNGLVNSTIDYLSHTHPHTPKTTLIADIISA